VASYHRQREALAREAGDLDRVSEAARSANVFERRLDAAGRCRRCGRVGPECAARIAAENAS
jgi:hypothetical protein